VQPRGGEQLVIPVAGDLTSRSTARSEPADPASRALWGPFCQGTPSAALNVVLDTPARLDNASGDLVDEISPHASQRVFSDVRRANRELTHGSIYPSLCVI
jgi:hypothetical protein